MKTNKKGLCLLLLGIITTFSAHAVTPASKAYLDEKMAVIQAEINAINLRVFGG